MLLSGERLVVMVVSKLPASVLGVLASQVAEVVANCGCVHQDRSLMQCGAHCACSLHHCGAALEMSSCHPACSMFKQPGANPRHIYTFAEQAGTCYQIDYCRTPVLVCNVLHLALFLPCTSP
jgi:hypothetical protein